MADAVENRPQKDVVDLEAAGIAGIPLGQTIDWPFINGVQVVAEVDLGWQAHILIEELPAAKNCAPRGTWGALQPDGELVFS